MRIEDLQAAARELPQHQPSEAQRSALRASLVEAARAERPEARPRLRRVGAAVALGGALAAAAALALWWSWSSSSRGAVADDVGARRATIQSSSGAHFEHTRVHGPPAVDAPGVIDEVVRLRQGRVAVVVEHLARDERFRVVTGDAEVEVRGTSFDVVVEHDRLVEVVVQTGLVEVRPDGRDMIALHPGERWRADEHPVRTAALEPAAAEPPAPTIASAPEPEPDPDPDRPVAPVPEPPSASPPTAPPPAAAPTSSRAKAPAPARMEHRGPGLVRDTRPDRIPEPAALPLPDAPAEGSQPARDAAATEQEPPRAAQKPAPTASEVAFGRGFRALRRGNYGEAGEQFEAAIASGPGSPLVDDARYWRAVALARSGQTGAAREALGEFLRLHARSPRAGEAQVMLGWMLLEAGDRAGAFRRFKSAAGDRDPAVRASAEKGLARIRAR
ncbi:MAG TPA: tetratricopeptide repeat protein [Kofleriaceae bacterium]|jgi:TolA-binding protein